jgi:hypothetical protein
MYSIVAAWITSILFLLSAYDYVRRAWRRESSPTLATWILMVLVMGLSLNMYLDKPQTTLTGNIGLVAAFINLVLILIGVTVVAIREHTLTLMFNRVQLICLGLAAIVTVLWFVADAPLLSYTLAQLIAVIAYIATIVRQWGRTATKPEPLLLWWCVLLANISAIYPAVVDPNAFAWIYLGRAIPSTSILIYVIYRKHRMYDATLAPDD